MGLRRLQQAWHLLQPVRPEQRQQLLGLVRVAAGGMPRLQQVLQPLGKWTWMWRAPTPAGHCEAETLQLWRVSELEPAPQLVRAQLPLVQVWVPASGRSLLQLVQERASRLVSELPLLQVQVLALAWVLPSIPPLLLLLQGQVLALGLTWVRVSTPLPRVQVQVLTLRLVLKRGGLRPAAQRLGQVQALVLQPHSCLQLLRPAQPLPVQLLPAYSLRQERL